jgi:eukaryotic-like serine/threonine-protein kinase
MTETPSPTILAGRYVLVEELGRGGMAAVWRANDEVLDRPVAVKILHEHLAEDPAFRERFSTEALAAARLTHPSIVNVFDTGAENGQSFIVMELVEGTTLAELIREQGPLEPDRAVAIMLPVLGALQFAHENGVVHRDIKPANILVSTGGMVKLVDLGLARAAYAGADVTTTGRVLGSVPYLSPEQVQGGGVDARSDVYSCGVVMYEMLTGRRPFDAETDLAAAMQRLTRDPVPPRAIRPGIPRPLEAAVLRAMARRPEDRFPSAENMAAALVRVRRPGQPTASYPPVRPAAPSERAEREGTTRGSSVFQSWMLVPLVAVVVAAVAITIGLVAGKLQLGGPLGVEAKHAKTSPSATPPSAAAAYPWAGARAWDPPPGDGHEHDELIPNLLDNDPSTIWYTSDYFELNLAPKAGVGVLFDLGSSKRVGAFTLKTPYPGFHFQVKVGDDPNVLTAAPATTYTATSNMNETLSSPQTGRYVLLWITQVVPGVDGGNRAAVGLFQVRGPG